MIADTVYTERYMRFASSTDNYRGYDVSTHRMYYKVHSGFSQRIEHVV